MTTTACDCPIMSRIHSGLDDLLATGRIDAATHATGLEQVFCAALARMKATNGALNLAEALAAVADDFDRTLGLTTKN